jgi:hypothetical protein
VGGALAIITYMILRAGLISGGPANVSDFGVVSISALVGIMSVPMSEKLRDIVNELFGIRKPEIERGESPEKKCQPRIKISALKTEIKVGEEMNLEVDVNKSDGSPAEKTPVHFAISDSTIAEFAEDISKKETNDKGVLSVKIKGKKEGDVVVTVITTIEEEEEMEDEVTGKTKVSDTIKN